MNMKFAGITSFAAVAMLAVSGAAQAVDIVCDIDAPNNKNYMEVPDAQVTECVDAGIGNINGNPANDPFLLANAGYSLAGAGTFDNTLGTWSFDSSLWGGGPLAIGFKFGTGNTPDEWFVYTLVNGVFSGTYEFFPLLAGGGDISRLSHVIVYNAPGDDDDDDDDTDLPEPGTLGLLGLGLLGVGLSRRRKV